MWSAWGFAASRGFSRRRLCTQEKMNSRRTAAIEAIDKISQEMDVIAPTQAKRLAILSMRE